LEAGQAANAAPGTYFKDGYIITIFMPLLQETKARQKQNKLAKCAVIFIDINLARKPPIHRKIEHNQLPNRKLGDLSCEALSLTAVDLVRAPITRSRHDSHIESQKPAKTCPPPF
jgi:hypothetical protein